MTYDKKNFSGISGFDRRIPDLSAQQLQDNPGIEYKANAKLQLFSETYRRNFEPIDAFASSDSFAIDLETCSTTYNFYLPLIQLSMALKSSGIEIPKIIQAVYARDATNYISQDIDKYKDEKQKKVAETTGTICFFMDSFYSFAQIPKNARLKIIYIDNKKEYGLILNSNFLNLGNFTGQTSSVLDKLNGTSITTFSSPGTGNFGGQVGFGECNPFQNISISHDNFIICGTKDENEREVQIHPGAKVCNYKNPTFPFKQFGAEKEFRKPRFLVTHWDVAQSTASMYESLVSKGYSMAFGVDRDGTIFQFANCGQEVGGAAEFRAPTIGCEMCNPIEPTSATKSTNLRCYGDEDGGRRRIQIPEGGFVFPGNDKAMIGRSYDYIYDFFDEQYFAIGALWEACSYAYNIKLQLPEDSWIDWRPAGASRDNPHPFTGATTPETAKQEIIDKYEGIIFHHNIDWADRENSVGGYKSEKWDIILLNRKLILQNALACRKQRNLQTGKFK